MKALALLVWAVAVVAGFFISGAVSTLLLIPLAPIDAGAGTAVLIGVARLGVWLAIVFLFARSYQALTRRRR